jgi:protocatechuate 3,4-dioxygenase beta subunit
VVTETMSDGDLEPTVSESVEEVENDARHATTDERGIARMNALEEGTLRVHVRHARYTFLQLDALELEPGQREITVELLRGCAVRVRVVDPEGDPVAGAEVEHQNEHGAVNFGYSYTGQVQGRRVDADGWAHYRHLPPGTHQFRVVKEHQGPGAYGLILWDGGQVDDRPWTSIVLEPGDVQELVLVREPVASIAGRVYQDGAPLGGATVKLVDPEQDEWMALTSGGPTATTDVNGDYRIASAEPRKWELQVLHPTRAMRFEEELTLGPGPRRHDVDLPVTAISGRVTDVHGDPVEGARVTAQRKDGAGSVVIFASFATDEGEEASFQNPGAPEPTLTDHDGRYTLIGVHPDVELKVRAKRKGFVLSEVDGVKVAKNRKQQDVDLQLLRGGSVDVRVTWSDPDTMRPLFVSIHWVGEGHKEPRYQTLEGENTIVRDLEPGKWRIDLETFEVEEGASPQEASRDVEVEQGLTGVVEFAR